MSILVDHTFEHPGNILFLLYNRYAMCYFNFSGINKQMIRNEISIANRLVLGFLQTSRRESVTVA